VPAGLRRKIGVNSKNASHMGWEPRAKDLAEKRTRQSARNVGCSAQTVPNKTAAIKRPNVPPRDEPNIKHPGASSEKSSTEWTAFCS